MNIEEILAIASRPDKTIIETTPLRELLQSLKSKTHAQQSLPLDGTSSDILDLIRKRNPK